MFRKWLDFGGESNHLPICIEISNSPKKPVIPFKFCVAWLKNEEVIWLIQTNWIPYVDEEGIHVAVHFSQNIS